MKLCVIGNSHAGMLVQAYRELESPALDLSFFARQGRGPEGVALEGNSLVAKRAKLRRTLAKLGMAEQVHIPDFQGFVVVAMTTTVFTLLSIISRHAIYGWESTQQALAKISQGAVADFDRHLMSQAALDAALAAAIQDNLSYGFVQQIRAVSDAPILLVPQPYPSVELIRQKDKFGGLRRLHWRRDGADVVKTLNRAHQQVFGALAGVRILDQPPQTVRHTFMTHASFMRGAGRLNETGRQPDTDILHANVQYGRLVLDQIREIVDKF